MKILLLYPVFATVMLIVLIIVAIFAGIYFEIANAIEMPPTFEENIDEYVDLYDNQINI